METNNPKLVHDEYHKWDNDVMEAVWAVLREQPTARRKIKELERRGRIFL